MQRSGKDLVPVGSGVFLGRALAQRRRTMKDWSGMAALGGRRMVALAIGAVESWAQRWSQRARVLVAAGPREALSGIRLDAIVIDARLGPDAAGELLQTADQLCPKAYRVVVGPMSTWTAELLARGLAERVVDAREADEALTHGLPVRGLT